MDFLSCNITPEFYFIYDVVAVLKSLKDVWDNTPPNWEGSDPCGKGWVGIRCTNSRVTAM